MSVLFANQVSLFRLAICEITSFFEKFMFFAKKYILKNILLVELQEINERELYLLKRQITVAVNSLATV